MKKTTIIVTVLLLTIFTLSACSYFDVGGNGASKDTNIQSTLETTDETDTTSKDTTENQNKETTDTTQKQTGVLGAYTDNGFEFTPTKNWEDALKSEEIVVKSVPGLFVFFQFLPKGSDISDFDAPKDIAIVMIDNEDFKSANAEITYAFDKSTTTDNGLFVVYSEKLDTTDLSEEDIKKAEILLKEFASDILPQIQNSDIAVNAGSTAEGSTLSFETTDIDGKPVASKELFAPYDITMINIWSTTCPYCITEMPIIEEEYQNKPNNVNIVGLLADVTTMDATNKATAKKQMAQTKVSYTNLIPNPFMMYSLLSEVSYVPTTIFVDKNGKVIGEPIISAFKEGQIEKAINERLAMLN